MQQLSFLGLEGEPLSFSELNPVVESIDPTALKSVEPKTIASDVIEESIANLPDLSPTLPPGEFGYPLTHGTLFSSPGGHFTYQVIGACCRLFDREELPWPCCRLQWRGKEPSWRRIGRRFILDLASRHSPSYAVEIAEPGYQGETIVITLYSVKLPDHIRNWWYSKAINLRQDGRV